MKRLGAFALLGLLPLFACDPPPATSADGAPEPSIARVWRSRCGKCHVRVEPGTRSRDELEAAFVRHRRRVHLHEEQWGELVTFLGGPPLLKAPVPCEPGAPPSAEDAPDAAAP